MISRYLRVSVAAFSAAFGLVLLLGPGGAVADTNPVVSSVSPNTGSDSGGDTVTLHGSGYYCNTGGPVVQGSMNPYNGHDEPPPHDYLNVFFGNASANILSTPSDSEMTVQTPAGEGTVDVTVTCVAGNTLSSQPNPGDHYTYISSLAGGSGGSGTSLGSNAADTSSAPSDLAQTGGGPLARAQGSAPPPWPALAVFALPAAGWFARRRLGRR